FRTQPLARFVVLFAALLTLFPLPMTTTSLAQDTSTGSEDAATLAPRFDPTQRLYDNANVLTEHQDGSFENDLERLSALGVEMVVYTRISTDDEIASQAFADQIRSEWQVESADGADDGLVLVLTYDMSDLDNHSVVASWGENTFPVRQLTADRYEEILADEIRPELEDGNFDFGLMYGVRRVLNYADYSPPDPAQLTSLQVTIGNLAGLVSAITLQAVVIGYVLAGVIGNRALTVLPGVTALWWYGAGMATMGIVCGVLGIAGRNGTATLIGLGVFLLAILVIPVLVGIRKTFDRRARTLQVPGRSTRPAQLGKPQPGKTASLQING
ncbi:MAG TPA: TPM domain-containing protein, partial [Thermomicrobiales bacterium]|nr:TPM domain-containing protein [Thermomicrobiales bacterium]